MYEFAGVAQMCTCQYVVVTRPPRGKYGTMNSQNSFQECPQGSSDTHMARV